MLFIMIYLSDVDLVLGMIYFLVKSPEVPFLYNSSLEKPIKNLLFIFIQGYTSPKWMPLIITKVDLK